MNRTTTFLLLLLACLVAACLANAPAIAAKLITSKDIRNGSVQEVDLDAKTRTKLANSGKPGPAGPQGERGSTGATGIQGPAGSRGPIGNPGDIGPIGATGPQGERGEMGPQGPVGPTGPAGQDGVTGQQIKSGELFLTADTGRHTIGIDCADGAVPVGGGFQTNEGSPVIVSSYPVSTGWRVQFDANTGVEVRPYVICITNR